MAPINSLGNTIASTVRPTDSHRGVSKSSAGHDAFQGSQASTPFLLGNPGFGNRSGGAGFTVSEFLG